MNKQTIKGFEDELLSSIKNDSSLFLSENNFSLEIDDLESFISSLLNNETLKLVEKKENTRRKRNDTETIYCYSKNKDTSIPSSFDDLIKKQEFNLDQKGVHSIHLCFSSITYNENDKKISYPILVLPVLITGEKNCLYIKKQENNYFFEHPFWIFNQEDNDYSSIPSFKEDIDIKEYLNTVDSVLRNDFSIHYSTDVTLSSFDFSEFKIYRYLLENIDEIKSNLFFKKYYLDVPKKEEIKSNIFEASQLHPILNIDDRMTQACLKAKNNQSFALLTPPGSKIRSSLLNIVLESVSDHKNVLIISDKNEELTNIYKEFVNLKFDNLVLPLLDFKSEDDITSITKGLSSIKSPSYSNDTKLYEQRNKIDEYSQTLYSQLEEYNISPYEIYLKLYSLKSIPDIDNSGLDIEDFDDRKYQFALNNLNFIKDEIEKFGKDYESYHFYGFEIPEDETFESFEKLLKNSTSSFIVIEKILKTLNPNKTLENYDIEDARNLMFFLKNFYNLSIIEPNFFVTSKRKNLTSKLADVLPLIAIEENLKRNITKIADDSIISLKNVHQIKDRLESKRKRLFNVFSSTYRKDMQLINEYALTPLSKIDAIELVHLVENYQVNHKRILNYYSQIKKLVSKDTNLNEQNFAKFVEENIFYKDVNLDLSFLQNKSISEINELQKLIPIREINSLSYPINAQNFFDKKVKNFEKMNLLEIKDFCTKCYQDIDNLEDYLDLISRLEQAKKSHYISYVDAFLSSDIKVEFLSDCFKKVYFKLLLEKVYSSHKILNGNILKDYQRLLANYEKENSSNLISNLNYVKKNAYTFRTISTKNVELDIIKSISKNKDHLSYLKLIKEYQESLLKLRPIVISTISNFNDTFDLNSKFDLVLIVNSSSINPTLLIPSILKTKQVIAFGDNYSYPTNSESLYKTVSTYDEVKFNHSYLNSKFISFSNKAYYGSNLFAYPNTHSHQLEYRILNITKNSTEQSMDNEILLELDRVKKINPEDSISIITSSKDQQKRLISLLENDISKYEAKEKFNISYVTDSLEQRDIIILSLPFIFQEKESIFETVNGRNYVNMMLTRARKHLIILNYKRVDILNKTVYSNGLRDLNEYLYTISKNNDRGSSFTTTLKEDIYQYLLQRNLAVIKDYNCTYPIDFVILKNNKPYIAIDMDNLKGENKKCTYERELLRKNTLIKNGFKYIKISTPYFYHKEKEAKLDLLTKITNYLNQEN